jgi:hypothetical protein
MDFKMIDQWDQLFDRDSIRFDRHLVYRFEIYFIYSVLLEGRGQCIFFSQAEQSTGWFMRPGKRD